MKSLLKIVALLVITVSIVSCKNDQKPNYQYMPNMYESVAYETYSESNAFNSPTGLKGKEGQLPPAGTIKRGFTPYDLPNTTEGYNASKLITNSPLDSTAVDMKKAEELFNIYCAICHGTSGDGTYGLNSMGSHANQLSTDERWLLADYVLKLKSEL